MVRFIASSEWFEATRISFGPALLAASYAQTWIWLYDTKRLDAISRARRARSGKRVDPETLSDKPFKRLAMLLLVPLIWWWFYASIAFSWVPMLSLVTKNDPIQYEFVVRELRIPSRGPDELMFKNHSWFFGGVPRPSDFINSSLKPGYVVRLEGIGNRWGMFYTDMEVVRRY